MLQKFEELFDEKIRTRKIDPVYFEFGYNTNKVRLQPYPVPNIHEEMFKKEVESLVLLGLISSILKLKPKTNQVHFLSELINLNDQLKYKTHPMPKINEMLLKLEDFKYDTTLDLNMGCYHIQLIDNESDLCTIISPGRKYYYKYLPMGVSNSIENFKHNTNDLFQKIE